MTATSSWASAARCRRHFGGGSVYRITAVTEEVARHVAKSSQPAPVSSWDFPKPALTHQPTDRVREDFDEPDHDDERDDDDRF